MIVPASAASMREPARSSTPRDSESASATSVRMIPLIENRPEKRTAEMPSA